MPGYVSGFCSNKCCEGSKPKTPSGRPMKTCTMVPGCGCKCHADIARMYAMMDQPRPEPEQNPEYRPFVPTWWMPDGTDQLSLTALYDSGSEINLDAPSVAPVGPPAPVLATAARAFAATPTGRRAKGLLEDEVRYVCNKFMSGEIEGPMTPKLIAQLVDENEPPSVGAIGAIFDRWVKLGFAETGKQPVRFISYTVEGMSMGLEKMKARAKRQVSLRQASQKRGVRM
jgi:hypothetical protein